MRLPRSIAAATAALLSAAVVSAGCGSDPGVVGSVRVGGTPEMLGFVQQAAADFTTRNPLARVSVDLTGTGDGFTLLCDGIADAVAAGRPATPREQRACAASGIRAVPLVVGKDAVVIITGRRSRVPACLTVDQLAALTGSARTPRRTWAGIGPAGLPVVVVAPEVGSSTRDAFVGAIIAGPSSPRRTLRDDAIPSPPGVPMAARVLAAPGAIGITGYAAARPLLDTVRMVQVNDGDGCVAPSDASVASGAYPLIRDLLMAIRTDGGGDDAEATAAFGDVVASPAMLGRPGSGLSADDIRTTEQAWDDRAAGGIGR